MRVLIIGDSLAVTTGFGAVVQHVAAELGTRGHDLHQLAGLDPIPGTPEPFRARGVTPYWTSATDPHGKAVLPVILPIVQPDVLCFVQHPGSMGHWLHIVREAGFGHLPYILYAPLEGAPVRPDWGRAYQQAAAAFTCTHWGSEQLRRAFDLDVPALYHGVDTHVFRPLEQWRRRQVRRDLGWERKFVLTYVARNAARKQHVRLLDALHLLKSRGVGGWHCYLHARPFEGFTLEGWDLAAEVAWRGLTGLVEFAPQERSDHGMPAAALAERMAAADLHVYPSSLEGFGLPIVESMACGLPLAITDDRGNMAEVAGDAPFWRLKVRDTVSWWNGVRLCHVDPVDIAQCIDAAMHSPQLLQHAAARSLARAQDPGFRWEPMATALAAAVERASARELVGMT